MFVLCNRHLIAAEDKVVSEQKEDKGVVIAKKDVSSVSQSTIIHWNLCKLCNLHTQDNQETTSKCFVNNEVVS